MRIKAWKWNRKTSSINLGVMLLAAVLTAVAQEKPFPELDQQLQPLKKQFNADIGKVRVLVIVDPT